MTNDQKKALNSHKKEFNLKTPSPEPVQGNNPRYARRQVEAYNAHLATLENDLLDSRRPGGWLHTQLLAIRDTWAELAGPPEFRFGAFCNARNVGSPDRSPLVWEEGEVRTEIEKLDAAIADCPDADAKRRLLGWKKGWGMRLKRAEMDFGVEQGRGRGPKPAEVARKARIRDASRRQYENKGKK